MTMDTPHRGNVTGLVLAGGLGRRMGRVNKAFVPFAGGRLVDPVIASLSKQVRSVWVSANEDAEAFEALGVERVLPDVGDDRPGPLAALEAVGHSGLLETDWIMTSPCDVPHLPDTLLGLFAEASRRHPEARAFYIVSGGRDQSTIALVHRSLLDDVAAYLASGERRVRSWLVENARAVPVLWEGDPRAFENVNTPEDLERVTSEMSEGR